jgi:hypothetical protein
VPGAGDSQAREDRTVRLAVPASAGYILLARLTLSAVSRLTPLPPEDVADMKLAVTEAATALLGDGSTPTGPDSGLRFAFEVTAEELRVDVGRDPVMELPEDEAELSRAIIAATVDRFESWPGGVRLAKRLPRTAG